MNPPVLLARLNYSSKSGSGHVFRSSAIIECAIRDGWTVIVVTEYEVREKPINHPRIHWLIVDSAQWTESSDANACLKLCSTLQYEITLTWLDHYGLSKRWESILEVKSPVIVIDDFCRQHSSQSVVVDYLPTRSPEDYKLPANQCLLGLRHLLLRKGFRSPLVSTQPTGQNDILLQFGGGDPLLYDLPVLRELYNDETLTGKVTWLQGRSDLLSFWRRKNLEVIVVSHCHDMASLYRNHKVALSAAGVSMWERSSVNLPSVVWQVAGNQEENFLASWNEPSIYPQVDAPNHRSEKWISIIKTILNQDVSSIREPSGDVYGANRVWNAIIPKLYNVSDNLKFKQFTAIDFDALYILQCLPTVRQFSRNPDTPTWEEHRAWCENLINSTTDDGWLVNSPDDKVIGWVKLSATSDLGFREISLIVNPEYHAMGIGQRILAFIKLLGVKVCGQVLTENIGSQKVFIKAGFLRQLDWFYWPTLPNMELDS